MKKLLFIWLVYTIVLSFIFSLFASCSGNYYYNVKLTNGSMVYVYDPIPDRYNSGDTLCVRYERNTLNYSYSWYVDGTGLMKDTTINLDIYRLGIKQ